MTATTKKRWLVEPFRRSPRWLACGAVFAFAPKCLLCVLAYAGAGAALGIGGPELCGAAAEGPRALASGLVVSGACLGWIAFRTCRRLRNSTLQDAMAPQPR